MPLMVSTLSRLGLINVTSHPTLVQSSDLVMALTENYVSTKRVVKIIIGGIALDLRLKNIEKVFHLLRAYQYVKITYHQVERWYKEHLKKAKEIIQSSFLIERTSGDEDQAR